MKFLPGFNLFSADTLRRGAVMKIKIKINKMVLDNSLYSLAINNNNNTKHLYSAINDKKKNKRTRIGWGTEMS